jgi:Fe-Mn family superoxide dismutase
MAFILPNLPYAKTGFADRISSETFDYHHGKHHKVYVDKANAMVAEDPRLQGKSLVELIRLSKDGAMPKLFNQVGQIWNHNFYWLGLTPEPRAPRGRLAALIEEHFGSADQLVDRLIEEATDHFASGWAALNLAGGRLEVTSYHDADTPAAHDVAPLFIFDVWEHAYYIDYRNARPDYAEAVLANCINWDFVAENLDGRGTSRADQPG